METIDCEEWKLIPDFPDYKISNFGNVMSLKHKNLRILKPMVCTGGYLQVWLCNEKITNKHLVHRLVGNAFIPNPKEFSEINHINGCKNDNKISNLEWVNDSENQKHAFRIKLHTPVKGEKHGCAKLNEKQVLQIYELAKSKTINKHKIAEMFNITYSTVCDIERGKSWKHLTNSLVLPKFSST